METTKRGCKEHPDYPMSISLARPPNNQGGRQLEVLVVKKRMAWMLDLFFPRCVAGCELHV